MSEPPLSRNTWDCIVVGGGVAGIAAAVHMADAGASVLLVEKRPFLGGRASSFRDQRTGLVVDGCQHITLGCCTALDALLQRLGCADHLLYRDQVLFSLPDASYATIQASSLPAPYHLLPAFLRLPHLHLRDKLSAVRLLRSAMQWASVREEAVCREAERAFSAVLAEVRLTPAATRQLIEPIVVSACNAQLDETAASYGLMVLYETLCASRTGYRLGLPRVPLADLYTGPTMAYLAARDSRVLLRTTVTAVRPMAEHALEVSLSNGERHVSHTAVVAVPYDVLERLFPIGVLTPAQQHAAASLRHSPIVGVHLWFDETIDCPDAMCLLDSRTHWLFDKGRIVEVAERRGTYLSTVTSAAHDLASLGSETVLQRTLADLTQRLPALRRATLRHWRVVKEHRATFVPEPGVDDLRPSQRSLVPHLTVAGDWTATGWPATMEGAARSGVLAARALLGDLARP